MCTQHQRFRPPSFVCKKAIEHNKIGNIYYVKARAVELRPLPFHSDSFIKKRLSGGGCLLDIGVHILDVAWWMMGSPEPKSLSGQCFSKLSRFG